MAQYWLDLFSPRTWEEAQENSFKLSGFRETRWNVVSKIKPGDFLVCYITEISRFSGILKVVSEPYKDETKARKVWKAALFPCVMNVEPVITLDLLHSIPKKEVISKLSVADKWGGIVRGSPNRLPEKDGETILKIIKNSIQRKIDYPLTKKINTLSSSKSMPSKKQLYGEPMNFRGLHFAPTNEQGVVYLFALVAKDLGFSVESIRTAFPDCEAMRCIDKKKGKWEKVQIEFEFLSSNYDHPTDGCDVVVCWKHDWKGCPENLEVIELSEVIKKLGN